MIATIIFANHHFINTFSFVNLLTETNKLNLYETIFDKFMYFFCVLDCNGTGMAKQLWRSDVTRFLMGLVR